LTSVVKPGKPGKPSVSWFASARTARKEQPDALLGFHASDIEITENDVAVKRSDTVALLFVIEEASGVPDEVFTAVEGTLSDDGSRLLIVHEPSLQCEGFPPGSSGLS